MAWSSIAVIIIIIILCGCCQAMSSVVEYPGCGSIYRSTFWEVVVVVVVVVVIVVIVAAAVVVVVVVFVFLFSSFCFIFKCYISVYFFMCFLYVSLLSL